MTLPGELAARMHNERLAAARADRQQAIARAWDYYEGRHPPPLLVRRGQANDNVIINLARPVVDKGIALLFGQLPTWQIDESAATETDAEQFLSRAWTANDRAMLLQELAQHGALAGLAAIKVNPRPDGTFRLINLDPAYLEIVTDDEDINEVLRYTIAYTTTDRHGELHKRQDIWREDDGQSWTMLRFIARGGDRDWRTDGPPVIWPYALPPVVHCKNLPCAGSIWGYGDLEDVRLNDALNLIASSTRKILRLHGYPVTIGEGLAGIALERGPDQMWMTPAGSRIYNLEMQSDLAAAEHFYQTLRAAFYAQARMPDISQVGNLGALTNFGLRVLFADALERTAIKRNCYGGLIQRVNRLLCLLAGYGDNVTTTLTWPDPLPTNTTELVTSVAAEQATGLTSDETLTAVLGRDYAAEQARLVAERDARQTPPEPETPDAFGFDAARRLARQAQQAQQAPQTELR